jgi:hypothetical protein
MAAESLCETCRKSVGCPHPEGARSECPDYHCRTQASQEEHLESLVRFQSDVVDLRWLIRQFGSDPRPGRDPKRSERARDLRGRVAGERDSLLMQFGELMLEEGRKEA